MQPSETGKLKCLVCEQPTSRVAPQVCTKHFLEGFGRTKPIPVKEEPAPLYISEKISKSRKRRG